MIVLLYVAMFLCFLSLVAKASILEWWKGVIVGLLLFGFCILMVPITTESSRMVVEHFFADQEARQYVAILASFEFGMALAFAFRDWDSSHLQKDLGRATQLQRIRIKLLIPFWWVQKHYVSLLILPTLFFVQTQLLYALPGTNFYIPALVVGGSVLILVPLLAWLCKEAFPLRAHREESLLFLSAALSILVLISTNHDEVLTTRPEYESVATNTQLLLTIVIFSILIFVGFLSTFLSRRHND